MTMIKSFMSSVPDENWEKAFGKKEEPEMLWTERENEQAIPQAKEPTMKND